MKYLYAQFCKKKGDDTDYVVAGFQGKKLLITPVNSDMGEHIAVNVKDLRFFKWKTIREYFNPHHENK